MEENKYPAAGEQQQYDEIDIMELLRKLLKEWKLILKWCGIAAVVGLIIGFSIPKQYTVTTKLAPEVVSKSGSSSLSSLASMAGINLSNMQTSDAVYPELYPEIVSSTPFVVDMFSVPVEFKVKKDSVARTDIYTYINDYTKAPWWSYVTRAPFKALGWFMGLFREKVEEVEGYSDINPSALTREQERTAKTLREWMNITVDKKTSVITASVSAQHPEVALSLSERLIDKLKDYVSSYRTEKSRKDLAYYQSLYDEAQQAYYAAQQKYARYVDANHGVVRQSVMTEQERLQNEMNLNYQLYNSCAQQLQMAKAKVQQETPVCVTIDPPTLPLKASKPSKMQLLVVFIFLGAVCASVWILWGREWVASIKTAPSSEKKDKTPTEGESSKDASSK